MLFNRLVRTLIFLDWLIRIWVLFLKLVIYKRIKSWVYGDRLGLNKKEFVSKSSTEFISLFHLDETFSM